SVTTLDDKGKPIHGQDGMLVMRAKYSGLHALRHFYASWCAARPQDGGLGLPLKTVQVRMGHSTLAMTADTYGHLFPSNDDAEVLAAGERVPHGVSPRAAPAGGARETRAGPVDAGARLHMMRGGTCGVRVARAGCP